MINIQRVKRIKSIIYTIIVILIFLPLVLLIALCISMIGFLGDTSGALDRIESYMASSVQTAVEPSPEVDSPELQGQALNPAEDPPEISTGQADSPLEPDEELSEPQSADAPPVGDSLANGKPNIYKPVSYPEVTFDTIPAPQALEADTLYLTFDNTPSANLPELLAVLDKHHVQATFFVWWGDTGGAPSVGSDYRAILDAGHSIGIHSGEPSSSLSDLYSSVDSFMEDFTFIFHKIEEETGVRTRLYRLPGGSISPYNSSRQAMLVEIKRELDARGFLQYDWNASAQDAVYPPLSMQQILGNLYTTIGKGERIVVLLHDGTASDSTVQALEEFIPQCLADGYTFKALDYDTVPVSFLE
jgi:peptidoglycan/xylan/chitin deacetylase (PgdA/CDA1 family)